MCTHAGAYTHTQHKSVQGSTLLIHGLVDAVAEIQVRALFNITEINNNGLLFLLGDRFAYIALWASNLVQFSIHGQIDAVGAVAAIAMLMLQQKSTRSEQTYGSNLISVQFTHRCTVAIVAFVYLV